jgi:hypothetical protein
MPAMNNTTQEVKDFLSWAKQVCIEHPDILEHMMKSTDVLDRVIAKRIMIIAGVEMNA